MFFHRIEAGRSDRILALVTVGLLSVPLVIGCVLANHPMLLWVFVVLVVLYALYAVVLSSNPIKTLLFAGIVLSVVALCYTRATVHEQKHREFTEQLARDLDSKQVVFRASADADVFASGGMMLVLSHCNDKELIRPVKAYAYNTTEHFLHDGEEFLMTAKLRLPRSSNNEFNFAAWLSSKGVYGELYDVSEVIPYQTLSTGRLGTRLRSYILSAFELVIGVLPERQRYDKSLAMCKALVYGSRDGFTDEQNQMFVRAGVTHVLSVSGLHFSLLLLGAGVVVRRIFWSRRLRILALLAIGGLYLCMCGFAPAAVRSAVMAFVGAIGLCGVGEKAAFRSLMMATAVICFITPEVSLDKGFHLSVLATAGILLSAKMVRKLHTRLSRHLFLAYAVDAVGVSLAAYSYTFVYSAYAFSAVSTVAVAASLAVTVLGELCLGAAWISVLLAVLNNTWLNILCASIISGLTDCIFAVCRFFSDLSFAYVPVEVPDAAQFVFFALYILSVGASLKKYGGPVLTAVLVISSVTSVILLI